MEFGPDQILSRAGKRAALTVRTCSAMGGVAKAAPPLILLITIENGGLCSGIPDTNFGDVLTYATAAFHTRQGSGSSQLVPREWTPACHVRHRLVAPYEGRADLPAHWDLRAVQLLLGHARIENTVRVPRHRGATTPLRLRRRPTFSALDSLADMTGDSLRVADHEPMSENVYERCIAVAPP